MCRSRPDLDKHTLIVKVALSVEIGVAFRAGVGTCRGVLCTVAMKRARAWFFVICPRTPADLTEAGLKICDIMLSGGW